MPLSPPTNRATLRLSSFSGGCHESWPLRAFNIRCGRPRSVWKAPDSSSLAVLYHKHDYGSTIRVPGSDLAVPVNVRGDNSCPHTIEEINAIYAGLHQRFPNAQFMAGSLTDVATATEPLCASLLVVNQEIGDTWIYGAPSDPPQIVRYREMARLRKECIANSQLGKGGPVDQRMLARLALAPERSWRKTSIRLGTRRWNAVGRRSGTMSPPVLTACRPYPHRSAGPYEDPAGGRAGPRRDEVARQR